MTVNHESTKGPRLNINKGLTGQAKTRKNKMNFVLSIFCVFVMKLFSHKLS